MNIHIITSAFTSRPSSLLKSNRATINTVYLHINVGGPCPLCHYLVNSVRKHGFRFSYIDNNRIK